MALTRWFVLVLAAMFTLGLLIPGAATADDQDLSRAGKKALKHANRVVRTARATDEQTVDALKALELFPHIDVTEFLVEKALRAFLLLPAVFCSPSAAYCITISGAPGRSSV